MTYARLLETAVDHFGRYGFDGASTRRIATASGTAMSSITYHFGGKEGLYLAAARHIGEQIEERQREATTAAIAALEGPEDGVIDGAVAMIESFAHLMLQRETAAWARFIGREQQEPTAAFECLFDSAMKGIFAPFAGLVTRARPDLGELQARATAFFLICQAVSLRMCRATACRVLGGDAIDAVGEALLMDRLTANVRCILTRESP